MLNLGMGQKPEGTHGKQNGSDREPEPEEKLEGEPVLELNLYSCIQYSSYVRSVEKSVHKRNEILLLSAA